MSSIRRIPITQLTSRRPTAPAFQTRRQCHNQLETRRPHASRHQHQRDHQRRHASSKPPPKQDPDDPFDEIGYSRPVEHKVRFLRTRLAIGAIFLPTLWWNMKYGTFDHDEVEDEALLTATTTPPSFSLDPSLRPMPKDKEKPSTPINTDEAEPPRIAEVDQLTKRESGVTDQSSMRLRMEAFIKEHQQHIISELEKLEGTGAKFQQDTWQRPEGGGGTTCVLQDGTVFEKAGVNTSVVYGTLPRAAIQKLHANHKALDPSLESLQFFAAGLSLVLHPTNPMAPTVHLNYRYFETADPDGNATAWWFGGGSDLTPSYLFDEDAIHFHSTLRSACDRHDRSYFPRFKKWCDDYFSNRHRGESRGVGGIFFDDLDAADKDREQLFAFVQDCLGAFLPSYMPIIEKRKDMPFTATEKAWQQLRRGRYVEFNLVHDRGTSFGLNTPGSRVESILMSLPLTARWEYMHEPAKGSREERLVSVLKKPVDWV